MPADPLDPLREALRVSPDNLPLRKHLAGSLRARGDFEQAIAVLKEGLKTAPAADQPALLLELGRACFSAGKHGEAFVIAERLIQSSPAPAPAYVLHARLLLATGEAERAVTEYRKALDLDPDQADADLAHQLGVDDEDRFGLGAPAEREVVEGRVRAGGGQGPDPRTGLSVERPALRFEHVGGMDRVKDEIRLKIIHPLTHPELYKAYGKKIGGGILLYGPPGCGKTHLARATAGEVDASFISIGIHEVLDLWVGRSERNLHEVFELARGRAPCVLFFDEVDALGADRSDMRHSSVRHTVNQFLSELDGVQAKNDGVLVLAATNAPWHVDSAFRRPGRFDRVIFVPPPDADARAQILQVLLQGKPTGALDLAELARRTEGFSGADLAAVVDHAVEAKLTAAIKSGEPQPLSQRDLLQARDKQRPTTKEWFATARNYALYSNQGGVYDDLLPYLGLKK